MATMPKLEGEHNISSMMQVQLGTGNISNKDDAMDVVREWQRMAGVKRIAQQIPEEDKKQILGEMGIT